MQCFTADLPSAAEPTSDPVESRLAQLRRRRDELAEMARLEREIGNLERQLLQGRSDITRSLRVIAELVCERFGLRMEHLIGRSRPARYTWPRHLWWHLAHHEAGVAYHAIGTEIGRDHGTIMHGCDVVRNRMASEPGIPELVEDLEIEARRRLAQRQGNGEA